MGTVEHGEGYLGVKWASAPSIRDFIRTVRYNLDYRPHRSTILTYVRPIVTVRVAWSVGLSQPCKNGSTDRDVFSDKDSGESKESHIRRSPDRRGKGQF